VGLFPELDNDWVATDVPETGRELLISMAPIVASQRQLGHHLSGLMARLGPSGENAYAPTDQLTPWPVSEGAVNEKWMSSISVLRNTQGRALFLPISPPAPSNRSVGRRLRRPDAASQGRRG